MKTAVKIIYVFLSLIFALYLAVPSPSFPDPLSDSTQSTEPADSETSFRRAYFTNFDREAVITHYKSQFSKHLPFLSTILPLRLNYPPEDAQTLVRDQTRSSFLEELVYPLRESIYVNGFKPREAKDDIWYKGVHYEQKITVKYLPGNSFTRVILFIFTAFLSYFVFKNALISLKEIIVYVLKQVRR